MLVLYGVVLQTVIVLIGVFVGTVIGVAALATDVERLRAAGVQFRNEIVTGPGGRQILLEDPSGNLVELFQPAAR